MPKRLVMKFGNVRVGFMAALIAAGHSVSACGLLDSKDEGESTNSSSKNGDAGAEPGTCETGEEGCACYGNGTCDDELSCLSHLCVKRDKDESAANSGDDSSEEDSEADDQGASDEADEQAVEDDREQSGDDASESDSPNGNDEASDAPTTSDPEPDQTDASDDEPATDATDEPATDEPTTDAPNTDEPVTDEPVTDETVTDAPTTDEPVTDEPVTDEPVTDEPVTDEPATDEPSTQEPSCEPSGSCADGNGTDCEDGLPIERDCSACELLQSCTNCCESVGYFAAQTTPFAEMPELIESFSASSTAAQLTVTFSDADQIGAVAFNLDSATVVDPSYLAVQLQTSGEVYGMTVSLEDNSSGTDSGCLYELALLEDDIYVPDYVEICWGDFELESGIEPLTVRAVNVRAGSAFAGEATLTVRGIVW